jgi:hypothetical protein
MIGQAWEKLIARQITLLLARKMLTKQRRSFVGTREIQPGHFIVRAA